ncbi:UDP-N-acetylglucosamine-N-acetylmuramylpentapeptide N-acetylglucosamine transferase [Sphaerotilus hippei]|uniref:UDP-N-acetylglucosamine--N-acetylmuramyl-(pentapeptide) pyrophosphoryl-undecaprenol N-acetylglucosamine transferase n=1 Tax=Sphaerotilus hippei TaxID=744406 RepID=A0A318H5Z6_9BURK|nr:undecaprenyldiphospho-muramoylpentapeptide beta-N-acetylglucosaminyltransferase [Sphaerotilus hippei]PXW96940.1 UDP-N-acetylglucosamine-N-acetylmuramylpentapeptide N-acetylglucosamine transferase [Sphaerotilus hippei]
MSTRSAAASRHLVIMAAGTGGHIIPGLAVAREMLARGWTVSWMGTPQGMENRLVPPTGLPLDTIGFAGLRGKGALGMVRGALQLLRALGQSLGILRRRSAAVVLGMGGYVCFPGGLMARLLGRPLMLVNADAALLLSNRSLLRWADRVAFGFDGEAARSVSRGVVTGNPVRREIEAIAPPAQRFAGRSGPLRVLVVGGSLGAQVLNDNLPLALAELPPQQRPQVIHQTGLAHHARVEAAYRALGLEGAAEVLPFIDDMAARLADCDVIVCRAGAVTVSELCAAGVAAVLVPLVVSTTSHQRDNAMWMAGHGAALHLPQPELTPTRLAGLLRDLSRDELARMATQARTLALPEAARRVADELEQLVNQKEPA